MKVKNTHSHMKWSWILMMLFLALSIIDYRFGVLGIACMTAPLYHAIRGRGKIHCSHYCPRGSLLGRFLKSISLENNFPSAARSKWVKHSLLIVMISVLSYAMYHANHQGFNFLKTSFTLFRFMTISLFVGMILGVIFKPRTWCQICPMGHGTALIDQLKKKFNKTAKKNESRYEAA